MFTRQEWLSEGVEGNGDRPRDLEAEEFGVWYPMMDLTTRNSSAIHPKACCRSSYHNTKDWLLTVQYYGTLYPRPAHSCKHRELAIQRHLSLRLLYNHHSRTCILDYSHEFVSLIATLIYMFPNHSSIMSLAHLTHHHVYVLRDAGPHLSTPPFTIIYPQHIL
jgi:hypothetical protein